MGADRQGSGGDVDGHGAGSCARVRSVSQPGGVMTDVPAQRAASRVADGQGLGWRVVAPLLRGKGETGRAHANRGWSRRGGDGEGHGDGDWCRGGPGGPECDLATMGAGRQGSGGDADGHGAGSCQLIQTLWEKRFGIMRAPSSCGAACRPNGPHAEQRMLALPPSG